MKRVHCGDRDGFSFSLEILFCLMSINCPSPPDPWTPGRLLTQAFVGWVADISGFPMFPRKSACKDSPQSPASVGCLLSPGTVQVVDLEQHPKFSRVFPVPHSPQVWR